jgi:hypothetical protein
VLALFSPSSSDRCIFFGYIFDEPFSTLLTLFPLSFILTGIISFDLFGLSNWAKRGPGRDAS